MILYFNEFNEPYIIENLDDDTICDIKEGYVSVYRFNLDTKKYQQHDGPEWTKIDGKG